jgi:hypothetical protein
LDVTRTLVSAPDADADHVDLDNARLPAACDTANSWVTPPAENTTAPDRATDPGFGDATTSTTWPKPPDCGDTVNQPEASQDQDSWFVDTVTVDEPPPARTDHDPADNDSVGMGACSTRNRAVAVPEENVSTTARGVT